MLNIPSNYFTYHCMKMGHRDNFLPILRQVSTLPKYEVINIVKRRWS